MPRRTTPKLSESVETFIKVSRLHKAKTSVANDQACLRRFTRELRDPQIHLVTSDLVVDYFTARGEELGANSFNQELARIRRFFEFAARRGWTDCDPMADLRPRRVPQRERMRLSAPQLRALIESAPMPRDRAMLAGAAGTALRASDLINLRVGDLDLDGGWVRVFIQKTQTFDQLPVTADLDREMRRWLRWYSERLSWSGQTLEPEMRLFPSVGATYSARDPQGKVLTYGNPKPYTAVSHPARVVQRGLERIGITATSGEGFHLLRRSLGRLVFEHASESGHDAALRVAQALLGHRSSQTTEGYLGLSLDRAKRDQLMAGVSLLGQDADVVELRAAE